MTGHLAFAIGSLVAAVASLLYAVRTGRRTREHFKARDQARLAAGQKIFTFNVAAAGAQHGSFNPLSAATDFNSRKYLMGIFAQLSNITLSPDQEFAGIQILETLPEGASIKDFINAWNTRTAEQLGLSTSQYAALSPLLDALARASIHPIASSVEQIRAVYADASPEALVGAHLKIVYSQPPKEET